MIDFGDALGTTGLDIAITTPAGAIQNICADMIASPANVGVLRSTASGVALAFTTASMGITATFGLLCIMLWVSNGATPGTVQLQFAQDTSSPTAITFRSGSYMEAFKVNI
jgi:hypothetical protein